MSKKSLSNDFGNTLYPHQRIYHLVAIIIMVSVHLLVAYLLLYKSDEELIKPPEKERHIVLLSLQSNEPKNEPKEESIPVPVQPKKQQKRTPKKSVIRSTTRSATAPRTGSLPTTAPTNILSQIAAAKEKREAQQKTLEAETIQQTKEAPIAPQPPSENDIALARINANIQAAARNRKGANGIFQVLNKGVQTGRFSFRGWTNDARENNWQTYEVDAGVGGNVELALVRRMIQLIREHYSGDFNWDSQRLNRVVALSARPKDNANLEKFLMREFFESK